VSCVGGLQQSGYTRTSLCGTRKDVSLPSLCLPSYMQSPILSYLLALLHALVPPHRLLSALAPSPFPQSRPLPTSTVTLSHTRPGTPCASAVTPSHTRPGMPPQQQRRLWGAVTGPSRARTFSTTTVGLLEEGSGSSTGGSMSKVSCAACGSDLSARPACW
jgi:hypothetical protein